MSWSPDLYIGELRPWPDSVHVVRGKTDEARRYFPERKDGQEALERRVDELCAEVERLRADQAHWELGNCPSCPNIADLQEALEQNAKLRELCADLYVLCYEHEVGWKLADSTWEKYEPCDLCKERHGGKSPCAGTSRDMSEECCDPYQAELFAKCMAALGIEVPDGEV